MQTDKLENETPHFGNTLLGAVLLINSNKMSETKFNYKSVGEIGNYYGGLFIMENEGKYYWLIENYNTEFDDLSDWSEIDKELYDSLVAYEARRSS